MDYFKLELENLQKEKQTLERKYSNLGTARFIVFLVRWAGCCRLYDSIYGSCCRNSGDGAFIVAGISAWQMNEQLEYIRAGIVVYERYLKRYDDGWKEFEEDGSEYLREDDLGGKRP